MREILEDSIGRLLRDHVDGALLRESPPGARQAALWTLLEEGGFACALVPESLGGAGAGWDDAYPIVFAAGLHALPLPLPEHLCAAWLLGACGIAPPPGRLTFAAAPAGFQVSREGSGAHASGTLPQVAWGGATDAVVVLDQAVQPGRLLLLRTADAACDDGRNIAGEPRATLRFERAPAQALADLPATVPAEAALTCGALLRAAQIAGAVEQVLTQCVRYAGERVQFGKPIARFQAVQQQVASLGSESAAAAAAAMYAWSRVGTAELPFATAVAKARTSEAAGRAATIGHGVHGAMGFTQEYTLHFATRRLWSWRSEYGTHAFWSDRIGRAVCAAGPDALWPAIVHPDTLPSATR